MVMMFLGKRPVDLGVEAGKFKECPSTPNCVSSQTSSPQSRVPAIFIKGDVKAEMQRLVDLVTSLQGNTLVSKTDNYIHVECKSKPFGFVHDLEYYWCEKSETCHVRSASRFGYTDFGRNRARVEAIRLRFNDKTM